MALLMFALIFGTERRNPLLAAGSTASAWCSLTYVLFAVALKTPLERGILGF